MYKKVLQDTNRQLSDIIEDKWTRCVDVPRDGSRKRENLQPIFLPMHQETSEKAYHCEFFGDGNCYADITSVTRISKLQYTMNPSL